MGVFNQIICTFAACCICMSIGIIFTWPSFTVNIFSNTNTTLHRPMLEGELALFGSLSSVGALISTPVAGFLLDVVGRKKLLVVASLSQVIAWALISACTQVEMVLTAVFISGLGGFGFLVVPVFISEICQESIRGTLTSFSMIFYSGGMLVSYLLGGLLPYSHVVYTCLCLSVAALLVVIFLRETPLFYMTKGLEEEAQMSVAFYRNARFDSKVVLAEMNSLRRALNPDLDDTPEEEKLNPLTEKKSIPELPKLKEKLSTWRFLKKSPSTRRAITVILVIVTSSLFQGLIAVQVFAEPLFLAAVTFISPLVCSVILAILTVVFGIVAAYLTDVAGRRKLLIYSSLASTVICAALGAQFQLSWAPSWATLVLIYMFTVTYTFGAGTVPYILGPEVFLPEIKSFMTMIVVEWAWMCNFVLLFIFNPLVSVIGLGPMFYIFSSICLTSGIYTAVCLPETNGLPVDAIQLLFAKRNRGTKMHS